MPLGDGFTDGPDGFRIVSIIDKKMSFLDLIKIRSARVRIVVKRAQAIHTFTQRNFHDVTGGKSGKNVFNLKTGGASGSERNLSRVDNECFFLVQILKDRSVA